jgi:hypothetical protein
MEKAVEPPYQAFLRQLRKYKDIEYWPMPKGFQERLAPKYLCEVYREGTALRYAKDWIIKHNLQNNSPAQEMLSIMQAVDDSILFDNADVINALAFEKLVRRAYGLERAFEDCWLEPDWKRVESKKQWKSKVKWSLCERYDVRSQIGKAHRIYEVDEEARKEMERDANLSKWYNKVSEREGLANKNSAAGAE